MRVWQSLVSQATKDTYGFLVSIRTFQESENALTPSFGLVIHLKLFFVTDKM